MNISQNAAVLRYLKAGKSITPISALNRFGIFRLGARIWELRHAGHAIKSKTVTHRGKHFSSYSL